MTTSFAEHNTTSPSSAASSQRILARRQRHLQLKLEKHKIPEQKSSTPTLLLPPKTFQAPPADVVVNNENDLPQPLHCRIPTRRHSDINPLPSSPRTISPREGGLRSISPRLRFPTAKQFVTSPFTSSHIQLEDKVLIVVPEDMAITNAVESCFDKKTGTIKSISEYGDVEVELKDTKEKTVVPSFCLCLEDAVLYSRIQKKSSSSGSNSNHAPLMRRHSQQNLEQDGLYFGPAFT